MRFDEKTRGLNAVTFALMTLDLLGRLHVRPAKPIQTLHVFDVPFRELGLPQTWIFHGAILTSALVVLVYIYMGGLRGAIYNEVLQFFLIVAGFAPLVWLGLRRVGGWQAAGGAGASATLHAWAGMAHASTNRLGGLVRPRHGPRVRAVVRLLVHRFPDRAAGDGRRFHGLGAAHAADRRGGQDVLSVPGHPAWPDRPGAHRQRRPARRRRGLPGQVASIVHHQAGMIPLKIDSMTGAPMLDAHGQPQPDYDLATPNLLLRYFPTGMLGVGLTALLASFMSGMAGNVTAFNTVWTYDIYQAHIRRGASDGHYLMVGYRDGAGHIGVDRRGLPASQFNNIMDLIQLICAFVNAPVFATFLLGMFWKRATGHGAFVGLATGTLVAALHHGLTLPMDALPGVKGGWLMVAHAYPSEMARTSTAIWSWTSCFVVTIVVSLATKPHSDEQLVGLVYSLTPKIAGERGPWYGSPDHPGRHRADRDRRPEHHLPLRPGHELRHPPADRPAVPGDRRHRRRGGLAGRSGDVPRPGDGGEHRPDLGRGDGRLRSGDVGASTPGAGGSLSPLENIVICLKYILNLLSPAKAGTRIHHQPEGVSPGSTGLLPSESGIAVVSSTQSQRALRRVEQQDRDQHQSSDPQGLGDHQPRPGRHPDGDQGLERGLHAQRRDGGDQAPAGEASLAPSTAALGRRPRLLSATRAAKPTRNSGMGALAPLPRAGAARRIMQGRWRTLTGSSMVIVRSSFT